MKDIVALEAPLAPLFKSHRSDSFTVVLAPWQEKLTVQCSMDENTTLFADGEAIKGDRLVLSPPPGITDHVLKAGQDGKPYSIRIKRYLPTPGWQLVNPKAPFAPRDSAGELYFNNKLWILGGYIPKVIPDIWCSSDGGVTWEQKPDLPNPTGINIPVQYVFDNAMWIFGEGNPQKLFRSEDGETWTIVNEAPPMGRRYAASGTVFNGYMWYAGGGKNDVWRSKDGKEWECVTEHAEWSPRQMFGGFVAHNGYLWVLGGGKTTFHIPEGTQNDAEFRIKGQGIQQLRGTYRGDLILHVRVEVPKRLNEKQKELLRQFDEITSGKEYEGRKSFLDKMKDIFNA